MQLFIKIIRIEYKNKASEPKFFKPFVSVYTKLQAFVGPVNPLMPGDNKRSYTLKAADLTYCYHQTLKGEN